MPELPEVEVICSFLSPLLVEKKLTRIHIRENRLRDIIHEGELGHACGQIVRDVRRLAKYLLIVFDHGHLVFHFGMSGNIFLSDPKKEYDRHEHAEFIFENHFCLRYRDPRRFGRIFWLPAAKEPHFRHSLGKEPLDPALTPAIFHHALQRHHKPIKNTLLAGNIIAGVGNIYANEALAYAFIHPKTPARALSPIQAHNLLAAIRQVLQQAIEKGGSTIQDYAHPDGQKGYFQNHYIVYQKEGMPCSFCGAPISKLVIAGRASFFCSHCQPAMMP